MPLLVGGSGLYFRAVVDDLGFPGEDPAVRAELEREADGARRPSALYRRLADLDPVAAAKIEPDNVRRIVRALEVAAITGTPFSDFAAAWEVTTPRAFGSAGVRIDRAVLAAPDSPTGWPRCSPPGGSRRSRGSSRGASGHWLTSTQAIGYSELARHLDGRLSLEEAWEATVRRTKNLARRQMAWFRRDPRVRVVRRGEERRRGGRRRRCAPFLEGA